MVRPPTMLDHPAPHRSESGPPLKQRRHSATDNAGLRPFEDVIEDAFDECIGTKPYIVDMNEYAFGGAGEVPEADLHAFISFASVPKRWSTLRREDYDRVKRVFERRGVKICEETSDDDLIEFKRALLLADLDLF